MSGRKLRIATCQFSETWQPRRNAATIRRYIAAAKRRRADVVHFHECALSGYGGPIGSADYDWQVLREATESVVAEAKRRRLWVVLGSSHPLTPSHKPRNCLYLISPAGRIVDRYDKRFCTAGDLEFYSPGDHFVTFELSGIVCGLLICYDLRFPELYRRLYKKGVRVIFQSFHNGRMDGPGIHEHIMRQTLQAHAGINAMWISAPNSSAYYSRWPSVFITPDGKVERQLKRNKAGLMVNTVDTAVKYYDAGVAWRDRAIRGILHSGRLVDDVRSKDRKSL
ncbi:MAG: carbon-nitrogen hydrolase family protein [Planctomycetota bacterium]|jgi:predicted amidohydrolase